jgi:uncharacterized Zn finger protein (UPF0148 family)
MSAPERAPCERCGQPMFHLAQVCPHCGARRAGAPEPEPASPAKPKPPPLQLTAEEARALLAVQATPATPRTSLVDVAKDLVLPRAGALELVTSLAAAPVTVASVAALALALVRERRARRDDAMSGAALLAVPASVGLAAVLLWEWSAGSAWFVALGASTAAWLVRTVARARAADLLDR